MQKEMEHVFGSKLISWLGIFTFSIIGIDSKLLDSIITDSLQINSFFTNAYMFVFLVYYIVRIYWYIEDKSLDRKEREKKLNNK